MLQEALASTKTLWQRSVCTHTFHPPLRRPLRCTAHNLLPHRLPFASAAKFRARFVLPFNERRRTLQDSKASGSPGAGDGKWYGGVNRSPQAERKREAARSGRSPPWQPDFDFATPLSSSDRKLIEEHFDSVLDAYFTPPFVNREDVLRSAANTISPASLARMDTHLCMRDRTNLIRVFCSYSTHPAQEPRAFGRCPASWRGQNVVRSAFG
jgi:hypothetical protein